MCRYLPGSWLCVRAGCLGNVRSAGGDAGGDGRCGGLGCPGAVGLCPPWSPQPSVRSSRGLAERCGRLQRGGVSLGELPGEGAWPCVRLHFTHLGAERRAGTYGACFGVILLWNKQEILL